MQVYVLESRNILIDHVGGCVCGVYSTRALADAAALLVPTDAGASLPALSIGSGESSYATRDILYQ